VEIRLKENVLRYKLSLKDQLNLEWSWWEEPSKGGMECTILAHIPAKTNAISVQNKRHMHWKALDSITAMNNDAEFATPAHSLLLKSRVVGEDRQAQKSRAASTQASPQAAKKKRFTRLDFECF
jgi:hypothetical protein